MFRLCSRACVPWTELQTRDWSGIYVGKLRHKLFGEREFKSHADLFKSNVNNIPKEMSSKRNLKFKKKEDTFFSFLFVNFRQVLWQSRVKLWKWNAFSTTCLVRYVYKMLLLSFFLSRGFSAAYCLEEVGS